MAMQLLAVGDLHLGAAPSRLPPGLSERAAALGTAAVWRRIVDQAIAQPVHAVLLAGDVVEEEDDFFEAYSELAQGVERLVSQGIRVLAVVGNHDVQVLPRLADRIRGLELLGRDGHWQQVTLNKASEFLTLHGWSFPEKRVRHSPLSGVHFTPGQGPNLALLHGDRDQPDSPYAPLASSELAATGLDGWLLGHIHKPDPLTAGAPRGYLGSATGLNPGESGPRGPWLMSVSQGAITRMEQWCIAPLHWQSLTVDLTGIGHEDQARERLLEAIAELDQSLGRHRQPPEAAALRVHFTGRTQLGAQVQSLLSSESLDRLLVGDRSIHYFVESCVYAIQPELSLEQLSRRSDPVGLLAQKLRLLENPPEDPARQILIRQAREQMMANQDKSWWRVLQTPSPDEAQVARWLWQSGLTALDQLLAQQGATHP
ncbi:MAG: DNA repair exonuclease [Oleiphilaceae bacterium]|nr:DNA repair exonuclease [Oleiphilaceae bacterium]